MEEDIQIQSPTVMFRGTPCIYLNARIYRQIELLKGFQSVCQDIRIAFLSGFTAQGSRRLLKEIWPGMSGAFKLKLSFV